LFFSLWSSSAQSNSTQGGVVAQLRRYLIAADEPLDETDTRWKPHRKHKGYVNYLRNMPSARAQTSASYP